jgi:hypothetical protein
MCPYTVECWLSELVTGDSNGQFKTGEAWKIAEYNYKLAVRNTLFEKGK